MIQNHDLSEEDSKIRERWLFVSVFCLLLYFVIISFFELDQLLGFIITRSIIFYLLYRCAYKNPGTIWLTLNIILIPPVMISQTYEMRTFILEDPIFFIIYTINTIIVIFYYYLTYKLIDINKKIRFQQLENEAHFCPEYHEKFLLMQQSKTLESLENIYLSISVKWPLWAFISEKEYIRKKCEISGFENKNHLLQKIQSKLYKAIFPIFLIAFFLLFSIYLIVNYNNCKLEIQNIAYYKKHLPGELYHSFLEQKLFGNNLREQHNPKGGYRLIVEKTNDPKIGEFVAIHYQARHSGSISLGYQNQNLTNYVLIDQWGSDYVSSTPCSKNEEDKIVNFLVNDVVPIFKNKF